MMQVKNNENYFLRKIGGTDGWELCYKDDLQNSPCIQVIAKLDNNFEGETADAFVKYDTKKDILLFEDKIQYVYANYDVDEYDTMPEEDFSKHIGNCLYARAGATYIDNY